MQLIEDDVYENTVKCFADVSCHCSGNKEEEEEGKNPTICTICARCWGRSGWKNTEQGGSLQPLSLVRRGLGIGG